MAHQLSPNGYDSAGTTRNNNVKLWGLIGDLRNLSIFAPGASGYQNWTTPVEPIQPTPVINHYQPAFNSNFVNVPDNQLPIFENGHQLGSHRNFVDVRDNQHLIGGNTNPNGHQPGLNRNFVNVPGNQFLIISNNHQFENGYQPGFNSNFGNVPSIQHLIGYNTNTNANQFSKVGSDSKNTFLFPHLPSSLMRESRTDDTVLIPYQISAAKFLLCTALHMFQIEIGNVIMMVDQWDNPVPQLTGTFQFGDIIRLKNVENREM